MKQQLKQLIAKQITTLEYDLYHTKYNINAYEKKCDRHDKSPESKFSFILLNRNKTEYRKIMGKLKNLRALQKDVKNLIVITTDQ